MDKLTFTIGSKYNAKEPSQNYTKFLCGSSAGSICILFLNSQTQVC